MNEFPDWLASTLASDASEGKGVLPPWIGSLKPEAQAIGPAFVVLVSQDDNLSVREAMRGLYKCNRTYAISARCRSSQVAVSQRCIMHSYNTYLICDLSLDESIVQNR